MVKGHSHFARIFSTQYAANRNLLIVMWLNLLQASQSHISRAAREESAGEYEKLWLDQQSTFHIYALRDSLGHTTHALSGFGKRATKKLFPCLSPGLAAELHAQASLHAPVLAQSRSHARIRRVYGQPSSSMRTFESNPAASGLWCRLLALGGVSQYFSASRGLQSATSKS